LLKITEKKQMGEGRKIAPAGFARQPVGKPSSNATLQDSYPALVRVEISPVPTAVQIPSRPHDEGNAPIATVMEGVKHRKAAERSNDIIRFYAIYKNVAVGRAIVKKIIEIRTRKLTRQDSQRESQPNRETFQEIHTWYQRRI
jgi:hypothetical protein